MQSLEPELESFLLRLAPTLAAERKGASAGEIRELEMMVERPLPRCYRWLLTTMGRSMGPLGHPRQDRSIATVLAAYRAGQVEPHPSRLLIGRSPDELMPMLVFLDLDQPMRDDALVISRPADGMVWDRDFETLREELAYTMLARLRVNPALQRCEGQLTGDGVEVMEELAPALELLGFSQPIPTGRYCGVFEREDVALVCTVGPEPDNAGLSFFRIGGPDMATLRELLGAVGSETSLSVVVRRWDPPARV